MWDCRQFGKGSTVIYRKVARKLPIIQDTDKNRCVKLFIDNYLRHRQNYDSIYDELPFL